jgi:hypothetical protein
MQPWSLSFTICNLRLPSCSPLNRTFLVSTWILATHQKMTLQVDITKSFCNRCRDFWFLQTSQLLLDFINIALPPTHLRPDPPMTKYDDVYRCSSCSRCRRWSSMARAWIFLKLVYEFLLSLFFLIFLLRHQQSMIPLFLFQHDFVSLLPLP